MIGKLKKQLSKASEARARAEEVQQPIEKALRAAKRRTTLKKKKEKIAERKLIEVLQSRRIPWNEFVQQGALRSLLPFLNVKDNIRLNSVISRTYRRKELEESYVGLSIPAFNKYRYTAKDDYKALRWMIHRKVNLNKFWLSINGSTNPGTVLQILFRNRKWDIALYFVEKCVLKDVHVVDSYGNASFTLIIASQYGCIDVVRLLLERGANVNCVNGLGDTALLEASEKGHCDTVRLLLDKGAIVNHTNNDGATALIWASQEGHHDVVKILIDAGGNVNHSSKLKNTPLLCAARSGHHETLVTLLEKGAITNCMDSRDETPLYLAIKKITIAW